MNITGVGQCNIKPDFKPVTTLGRFYEQLESLNWRAYDFGSTADYFEAHVTFIGTSSQLHNLISGLFTTRNLFQISPESGEEYIFGADVDIVSSSAFASAWKIGDLVRRDLVTWECPVILRLINPAAFYAGTSSLSNLRFRAHSFISSTNIGTNYSDTGAGILYLTDHPDKDSGIFKATFLQKTSEMQEIRRFIRSGSARTGVFTWTAPDGIFDPFGPAQSAGSYDVRIVDWKDNGRIHPDWWTIDLTFAQER